MNNNKTKLTNKIHINIQHSKNYWKAEVDVSPELLKIMNKLDPQRTTDRIFGTSQTSEIGAVKIVVKKLQSLNVVGHVKLHRI